MHIGRELRRRIPEKAGQRHPLLTILYSREEGKVVIWHMQFNYAILDEEGRCSKIQFARPRAKRGANQGCKVVDITDYDRAKLTGDQNMLIATKLWEYFGEAMDDYANSGKW